MDKIFILIFLFLSLTANAQKKEKVESMDISHIIPYEDFQGIKQFILEQGLTMTYCNMYNNNPTYSFSEDVQFFLNPIVQFLRKEDEKNPDMYDAIVIRCDRAKYPYYYTDLVQDRNAQKVLLKLYSSETEEKLRLRIGELDKYITYILKEIRQ